MRKAHALMGCVKATIQRQKDSLKLNLVIGMVLNIDFFVMIGLYCYVCRSLSLNTFHPSLPLSLYVFVCV